MSYWYIDIDAPLGIPDAEAAAEIHRALSPIGHRLLSRGPDFAAYVEDGLPFITRGGDGKPLSDLPPEGWRACDGRLQACLFVEDLTRTIEDGRYGHDILFAALAKVIAAESGDIVGAMAGDNDDCKGPLIHLGDTVRWMPSMAADPAAHPDLVHREPVDRLPADLVIDHGQGFTCGWDYVAFHARMQEDRPHTSNVGAEDGDGTRTSFILTGVISEDYAYGQSGGCGNCVLEMSEPYPHRVTIAIRGPDDYSVPTFMQHFGYGARVTVTAWLDRDRDLQTTIDRIVPVDGWPED